MKQPKLKVVTPVWAQHIEVVRHVDILFVTGWGRVHIPYDAKLIAPEKFSQMDIFQRFHRYALRQLSKRDTSGDAGVYQFADATTDEKLIAFVQEFGPVWGVVDFTKYEENGTTTIIVAQTMESLRDEQKTFAAVAKILQQVNRNSQADAEIIKAQMFEIPWLTPYGYILSGGYQYGGPTDKKSAALYWANLALCLVFNGYPPKLIPYNGEVFEMPEISDEGIRNAIYWQLRRDYLAQRAIGTCLHCGNHFPVYKRGTHGCSEPCRRALRNQKYWNKSKATINAERREKRTGGE